MAERTTVYLEQDVLDLIFEEKRSTKRFNLSKLVNSLLRTKLELPTDAEIRKKRLEVELKKDELMAMVTEQRIKKLKIDIITTKEATLKKETEIRLKQNFDEIMRDIYKTAETVDTLETPEKLLEFFSKMMIEYPEYSREIGATYDMKSWRKTAGYVKIE